MRTLVEKSFWFVLALICVSKTTGDKHRQNDDHILLALTAYTHNVISVIDLNNPNSDCDSIVLEPFTDAPEPQSMHASFLLGQLLVCNVVEDSCFYYRDGIGAWMPGPDRQEQRFIPFGLDVDSDRHWVSGGDDQDDDPTSSSEMYDGTDFSPSLELPISVSDHCVVALGGDEVMLIGGVGNSEADALIINLNTGDYNSTRFPLSADLWHPACGLAKRADGSRVVVTAGGNYNNSLGVDATYIFELDLGVFIPGPFLPEARTFARAVPYKDSFLVVGGAENNIVGSAFREDILLYDADLNDWVVLPQKLNNPDFITAALLVPDSFNVNCS